MTKPHVSLLVVTSHKPKSHVILTAGKNFRTYIQIGSIGCNFFQKLRHAPKRCVPFIIRYSYRAARFSPVSRPIPFFFSQKKYTPQIMREEMDASGIHHPIGVRVPTQ